MIVDCSDDTVVCVEEGVFLCPTLSSIHGNKIQEDPCIGYWLANLAKIIFSRNTKPEILRFSTAQLPQFLNKVKQPGRI